MKYNTRFNPTINGPLHLGHLYIALVNEHEAHASGGEFIVRFDDNQRDWQALYGQTAIDRWKAEMMNDLGTFLSVDRWTSQAENESRYPLELMPPPFGVKDQVFTPLLSGVPLGIYQFVPEFVPDRAQPFYPYAPAYTAERAFMDRIEGVNWLIRGIDLITECAFYEYVRNWFGYPAVRQTYLPRLKQESGGQLSPVSKTLGGNTIADSRNALGDRGVLEVLRHSCLIDPAGPFAVRNVKSDPRLVLP